MSSQTSWRTRRPVIPSKVAAPTNSRAPAVMTTSTVAPAVTRPRATSAALYAAMPPETPRTTRRPVSTALESSTGRSGLVALDLALHEVERVLPLELGGLGRHDLALGDLLEGDRQRLVRVGHDQRRDVLAEALAELAVVLVDLAGALGGEVDEVELGVHGVHEVVDAGDGRAFRAGARRTGVGSCAGAAGAR